MGTSSDHFTFTGSVCISIPYIVRALDSTFVPWTDVFTSQWDCQFLEEHALFFPHHHWLWTLYLRRHSIKICSFNTHSMQASGGRDFCWFRSLLYLQQLELSLAYSGLLFVEYMSVWTPTMHEALDAGQSIVNYSWFPCIISLVNLILSYSNFSPCWTSVLTRFLFIHLHMHGPKHSQPFFI